MIDELQKPKPTMEPTLIEEKICKAIEHAEKHSMDKETTETLIRLNMGGKGIEIPESKKPFLYKMIEKRVEHCFSFKITDARLILFLCVIANTPGNAIMYLWYLQYWSNNNHTDEIDLERFCEIFPVGFPSKETLTKIWDSQKVSAPGSDNLVDHADAGKSLFAPVTH